MSVSLGWCCWNQYIHGKSISMLLQLSESIQRQDLITLPCFYSSSAALQRTMSWFSCLVPVESASGWYMGTWMGKGDMQARVRIAGLSKNVLSLLGGPSLYPDFDRMFNTCMWSSKRLQSYKLCVKDILCIRFYHGNQKFACQYWNGKRWRVAMEIYSKWARV